MEKKAQRNFLWIALLVLGTIWILARHNRTQPYYTVNGLIFGTVYNITYQYDDDLKAERNLTVRYLPSMIRPQLHESTGMRILYQIPSLQMYSVVVWKYPKKRMVHSILRLLHWPMPGGLVSRKAHFLTPL